MEGQSYRTKLTKKTNCRSCGFFDGTFCRLGLGWSSPKLYCRDIWRISDRLPRCGKCKHFSLNPYDRSSGHCSLHDDFRNFYNCCGCTPGFLEVPGKDLRPNPEPIPTAIKWLHQNIRTDE